MTNALIFVDPSAALTFDSLVWAWAKGDELASHESGTLVRELADGLKSLAAATETTPNDIADALHCSRRDASYWRTVDEALVSRCLNAVSFLLEVVEEAESSRAREAVLLATETLRAVDGDAADARDLIDRPVLLPGRSESLAALDLLATGHLMSAHFAVATAVRNRSSTFTYSVNVAAYGFLASSLILVLTAFFVTRINRI